MTRTPASATERALHWLVAGPALALVASGAVLYAPALSQALGLLGRPAGPAPSPGRFNGGQRLFAALAAAALLVLLATGVPMYWWGWFAADLVSRARDVHLLAAFGLTALVLGH